MTKAAVPIYALLDPQLREALENLAKSKGITPSEYLEHLMREELDT